MKRLIALVLILSLSGCGLLDMLTEQKVDTFPQVQTVKEAANWVRDHITYQTDMEQYGVSNYWATPEQTLESGMGDCEDQALIFLRIVHDSLGQDGEVYVTAVDGGYHAKGVVGKVEWYAVDGEEFVRSYTYIQAMNRAEAHSSAKGLYEYNTD
jgi:hypothetical protein